MPFSRFVYALGFALATGCSAVGPHVGPGSEQTGGASAAGTCVDNVLCIRGDHFDTNLCKCVPNADAGSACIDNVLCIQGSHFDTNLCKCVPNADAGSVCVDNVLCIRGDHFDKTLCKCVPDVDAGPVCIENVLCIRGDHFDKTLCKCVPDQVADSQCSTAADCKGALPALCEQCADGSTACAHFECVAGACQTAICPAKK